MTEMGDAWPTGGAPPVPAAAPFTFQKPHGKLDWREMSKIDLERVNREVRAAGCSNQALGAVHRLSQYARGAGGH